MSLKWSIILFSTSACLYAMINQCCSERKLYISLERPTVEYSNPKLVANLVVKARRLSRGDPVHYVTVNLTTLVDFNKLVKKLYISLERPTVEYSNPKLVANLVVKARRLSRGDPVHYVTVNLTTLVDFNKLVKMEIAFYQLLSNVYKRSFVEWRVSGCEFLEKDELLGASLRTVYARSNGKALKCPLPPGNYSFKDMYISLSSLLYNFPFEEGRLFFNVSRLQERAVDAHIDFQIKSFGAERNIDKKN